MYLMKKNTSSFDLDTKIHLQLRSKILNTSNTQNLCFPQNVVFFVGLNVTVMEAQCAASAVFVNPTVLGLFIAPRVCKI